MDVQRGGGTFLFRELLIRGLLHLFLFFFVLIFFNDLLLYQHDGVIFRDRRLDRVVFIGREVSLWPLGPGPCI